MKLERPKKYFAFTIWLSKTLILHKFHVVRSWSKFTWIEHEPNYKLQNLREPWSLWIIIFLIFSWFWAKNQQLLARLHMKSLRLWESGMNEISQFRTEVKRDSVKCKRLLLSVNFQWTGIHWPISNEGLLEL